MMMIIIIIVIIIIIIIIIIIDKELNILFEPKVARRTIERSQKSVISQNYEIVRDFRAYNYANA